MFELIQDTHYAFKCFCVSPEQYTCIIKYHNLGPENREISKNHFSISHSNDSASFQKKEKRKKIIMSLENWPLNGSKLHKDGSKGSDWKMLVPSNREGSFRFGLVLLG